MLTSEVQPHNIDIHQFMPYFYPNTGYQYVHAYDDLFQYFDNQLKNVNKLSYGLNS